MSFDFTWWGSYQRNSPGTNKSKESMFQGWWTLQHSSLNFWRWWFEKKKRIKKWKKSTGEVWVVLPEISLFNLLLEEWLIDEHTSCRLLYSFYFSLNLCLVSLTFPSWTPLTEKGQAIHTLIYTEMSGDHWGLQTQLLKRTLLSQNPSWWLGEWAGETSRKQNGFVQAICVQQGWRPPTPLQKSTVWSSSGVLAQAHYGSSCHPF